MRLPNFWHNRLLSRLIFQVSAASRRRKLQQFYRHAQPVESDLVLDVGVTPVHWSADRGCGKVENFLESSYPWPRRIVGLSLDPLDDFRSAYAGVLAVQADACHLPFADKCFDIVFTNAVIEHVGDRRRQAMFVSECLRVARKGVFLAAPNRWFAYDTHVAFPLVHWLPRRFWKKLTGEPALHLISLPSLLRLFSAGERPRRLSAVWAPSIVLYKKVSDE